MRDRRIAKGFEPPLGFNRRVDIGLMEALRQEGGLFQSMDFLKADQVKAAHGVGDAIEALGAAVDIEGGDAKGGSGGLGGGGWALERAAFRGAGGDFFLGIPNDDAGDDQQERRDASGGESAWVNHGNVWAASLYPTGQLMIHRMR